MKYSELRDRSSRVQLLRVVWNAVRTYARSSRTSVKVVLVGTFCGLLVGQSPALAETVDDFFRQHAGVDYQTFVVELQTAYAKSSADTNRANELFFLRDGSGVRSQNAGKALRLYLRSKDDIGNFVGQYEKIYELLPILFVQMDYVDVENLKGWAMILLTQSKRDESVQIRTDLVDFAGKVRVTIGRELQARQFPQMHEMYRRLDAGLKSMMSDSILWIVLHYSLMKDQAETTRWIERAEQLDPKLGAEVRRIAQQ